MFRLPAYDPVRLAMLGFGILAVVALTFASLALPQKSFPVLIKMGARRRPHALQWISGVRRVCAHA